MLTDCLLSKRSRRLLCCWLGLGMLAAGLVACTPEVTRQTASIQPEGSFSSGGETPLPDQWWRSFEEPTLDRLIDQALADNLSLQSAWDRLDRARALARRAGADLFPKVDGDAGFSSTRTHNNSRSESNQNFTLGLAARYEVDLWGRIQSTSDAARIDAQASAEDLRTAALTISARVAATWFQLLEQYGQNRVLTRQLQTNRQTLELITLQFRTGQVGIADVLQQRQLVESNQGELALVTGRSKVLENQLAVLLGLTPDHPWELPEKINLKLPPLPQTGLQSGLLTRRPDIQSAWLRIEAADERVAAAIADRFPRLSLTGRANTNAENLEDLFDDWLASIAANLLAPLIDGGQRRAEVDRTRALAAEALHDYGQTVLEALAEVENALAREEQQTQYLQSVERQLVLAGQATERIRDRYINGAEDYQRVLISLLSEQQLQRTQLTARRDLFENRVNLCRALAGGWEMVRHTPDPQSSRGN